MAREHGLPPASRPGMFKDLNFSLPGKIWKIAKPTFPNSKIHHIFQGGSINQNEQLYFWDEMQITNGFGITKSGSEMDLNLV
jgi:hypothetical protein